MRRFDPGWYCPQCDAHICSVGSYNARTCRSPACIHAAQATATTATRIRQKAAKTEAGNGLDLCRICSRPTALGLAAHEDCYTRGRRLALAR